MPDKSDASLLKVSLSDCLVPGSMLRTSCTRSHLSLSPALGGGRDLSSPGTRASERVRLLRTHGLGLMLCYAAPNHLGYKYGVRRANGVVQTECLRRSQGQGREAFREIPGEVRTSLHIKLIHNAP